MQKLNDKGAETRMIIIGEKLNSSIPKSKELMANSDVQGLKDLVKQQVEAGVDYIDINAGIFISTEVEMLKWLVNLVQEETEIPLCIDTTNSKALEAALKLSKQKAMINSISLEGSRFEKVSGLAIEHDSAVIGLCQKSDKIPDNVQERIEAGVELAEKMLDAGMKHENVYLDPLVTTVATQQGAVKVVYDTIIGLKKEVPYAGILCGLSNVGFVLPRRELINCTFLAILGIVGLDGAIIDPGERVNVNISNNKYACGTRSAGNF